MKACKPDVAIPLVAMVVGMGLWLVIGATAKSRINRHAVRQCILLRDRQHNEKMHS